MWLKKLLLSAWNFGNQIVIHVIMFHQKSDLNQFLHLFTTPSTFSQQNAHLIWEFYLGPKYIIFRSIEIERSVVLRHAGKHKDITKAHVEKLASETFA